MMASESRRILSSKGTVGALSVLMAVVAAGLAIKAGDPAKLPSVALGSTALLYAERTVALFAAFLLLSIVAQRAFTEGRLPDEISGRGIRYADRATVSELKGTTQDALAATERLLARTREELAALKQTVEQLQTNATTPSNEN